MSKNASSRLQQNNASGIVLNNELKIKAYTGKINKVYVVLVQCLLIYCSVLCSMLSFTSSMNYSVDTKLVIFVTLVATIVNYFGFILLRYNDNSVISIIVVFAYVIYFMLDTDRIGKELITAVSKYLDCINDAFNLEYLLVLNIDGDAANSYTHLVIILMLFIIMIVSYNVVMGLNRGIYLLVTAIWPVLSIIVAVEPQGGLLIGYIGITVVLFLTNTTIKSYKLEEDVIKNKKGKKLFKDVVLVKVSISMAIAFLALFIVVGIVFSKNKYENNVFLKNLSVELHGIKDNIIDRIQGTEKQDDYSFSFFDLFKDRSVLGNGKISDSGTVKFTNDKMFDLVSNRVMDGMYLKNYIGLEYNNGWLTKDLHETDLSVYRKYENQLGEVLKDIESYEIRDELIYNIVCVKDIQMDGVTDLIISAPSVEYNILADGTLQYSKKEKDMVVAGYEIEFAGVYAHAVVNGLLDEIDIDDTVNMSYYLEVPQKLKSSIDYIRPQLDEYINKTKENSQLMGKYEEYAQKLETIKAVVNYFNNEYTYTLNPGISKEDMDPVEYFLKYNKKGYCMYYAAAATAILRDYKIPARYV